MLILLCLTSFAFTQAQEKEVGLSNKNEVKGNGLFLVLGAVEFTYERILTEDSSVGASLFFAEKSDFKWSKVAKPELMNNRNTILTYSSENEFVDNLDSVFISVIINPYQL